MSIENFKNPWVDEWKRGGKFDPDWLGEKKALELIKNENQLLTRKSFPSPSTIMSNYGNDRFTNEANECAVRLSIALIKSGVNISGSSRFRTLIKTNDGRMVQPSAAALADWISTTIGQPKIFNHPHGKWQKNDFISQEGLIYFAHPTNPNRGGDGPGHIDVISGGEIGSGFYPNKKIWFWEYGIDEYVKN